MAIYAVFVKPENIIISVVYGNFHTFDTDRIELIKISDEQADSLYPIVIANKKKYLHILMMVNTYSGPS